MKLASILSLCIGSAMLTAACGSKAPATTTPTDETTVVLPDLPFDKLNHEQQIAFMKQKVMPAMMPVFQNHDAKEFAEFSCVVCHGEAAKEGQFEMPNPKLPNLDVQNLDKYEKEDVEWMAKEVLPTMAKILNEPIYSKDNPKGFGCLHCHTPES